MLWTPSRRDLLFGAGSSSLATVAIGTRASAGETVARDDLAPVFQKMGLVGCFAALDVAADRLTLVNTERARYPLRTGVDLQDTKHADRTRDGRAEGRRRDVPL